MFLASQEPGGYNLYIWQEFFLWVHWKSMMQRFRATQLWTRVMQYSIVLKKYICRAVLCVINLVWNELLICYLNI